MISFAFTTDQSDIFAKTVCWWTQTPFSHCEVVVDSVWYAAVPGKGVIAHRPPADMGSWITVEVPARPYQQASLETWLQDELGCGYDWRGLLFAVDFPRKAPHPKKWFCSEYAAMALSRLAFHSRKHTWEQTPYDVYLDALTFAGISL